MAYEILCAGCATRFVSKVPYTKYCCMRCRRASKKAKPKHCVNCACLFTPIKLMATGKFVSYNAGKTCSAACQLAWNTNNEERKRKIGDSSRGVKHHNWQGGKSLLNSVSARGPNWPKQRAAALKRDGFACVCCGMAEAACRERFGRGLDVDHRVPFHNFGDYRKANALSNLQSLCASCHRVIEATRGMVQMVLPIQDSAKRQHKGYVRGERVNTAKLTAAQVIDMRRRAALGESRKSIAERYGAEMSNTHYILSGRSWRHLLPARIIDECP